MLLAAGRIEAQVTTAEVVGTVSDSDGRVISGAQLLVENVETHIVQRSVASPSGGFVVSLLKPGNYTIHVSAPAFQPVTLVAIQLIAGDRLREEIVLKPGEVTESVEVTAENSGLATDTAATSHTIAGVAVQDLPLSGRNYSSLIELTPGVNGGPPNGLTSGVRPNDRRQSTSISVLGQSEATNNQMIDGMDNNERYTGTVGVQLSVESISEVRVVSNIPPASLGRAGGGVVDIITRSGTDRLHGELFEYVRNTALQAYPYQFGAANPIPSLHRNQFGGSVFGPVFRKRTFFFADAEWYRLAQGQTPSALTVPTLYEEEHPGDFSDTGGAVLSASEIDPTGQNYFSLFPAPNSSTSDTTYIGSQKQSQNSSTYDARIDHDFGVADKFFSRVSVNRVKTFIPGIFPETTVAGVSVEPGGSLSSLSGNSIDNAVNGMINHVHIIHPNLILQATIGYSLIDLATYPLNYGSNVNQAFGQTNINYSALTSGLAPITVTAASALGGSGWFVPVLIKDNTFQYLGALNWIHGQHDVKIGGSVVRRQVTETQDSAGLGYWVFSSLSNLLKGSFTYAMRNNSLVAQHYRTWEPSAYVQDDWSISHRLTLNLGVRYDIFTPYTEILNRISNFDPVSGAIVVAGENGVSRTAGVETDFHGIAPRVGFAFAVTPATVVHGGFGLSFYPANYTVYGGMKNQPFTSSFGPCSSSTCASLYSSFEDGLPVPTASSSSNPSGTIPYVMNPDFRTSYVELIKLNVQREFGGSYLFTAGYAGLLGRHLPQMIPDMNAPPPNTSSSYNILRPYYAKLPNVTTIGALWSRGSSSYHSLQLSLERRIRAGNSFAVNYTLAHGIDDVVDYSNQGSDGYASVPSQLAQRETASSDLDMRQRLAISGTYVLPFGNTLNGWKGILARGWQLNGTGVLSTGIPFTVVNASNRSGTNPGSSGTDRPDQTGSGGLSHKTVGQFFYTSAFSAQTLGTLGSERRNSLYGPGFAEVNLSLFKMLRTAERGSLQLRIESFNVLNHANFAQPNLTLGGASFGALTKMTTSYQARNFELALRLGF